MVLIQGISCTLEKRICQGGCEKEFWTCPQSTAEHARSDCKFVCNVPIDQIPEHIMRRYDQYANPRELELEKQAYARQLFSKTNPKTKPIKLKQEKPKPLPREEDPKFIRQQRKWNKAIGRAKLLMERKDRIPKFREAVASIASAVVTNKKNFSIKCFSASVGLDRKTLQSWIHVKCDIINQLSSYDGNFLAARKTREFLRENPESPLDLNVIFLEEARKCKNIREKSRRKKSKSNGLLKINFSGKTKVYRMKIKIKYAS